MMRGFSLLELLVAMFVVAIGVLGLAGLQIASTQSTRSAMQRSHALLLADDIIERIRANPQGGYAIAAGRPPGAFADCLAQRCSGAQLARFDATVWKCALGNWNDDASCQALPAAVRAQQGLPNGDGSAVVRGDLIEVAITWGDGGSQRLEATGSR